MSGDYQAFLARKRQCGSQSGFEPLWLPDFLKPFQTHLCDWSIRKGRAAILADCGLGKTPMQLVWAQNVLQKTNRPVLILTPLAVVQQTIREAHKFGMECLGSIGGSPDKVAIHATNYEKLHLFDPADWGAIVKDEASAIKGFNGARRAEVTAFARHIPYRLQCTATAAPNDYTELGTLSEALGEMGLTDMLGRFFKDASNDSVLVSRGRKWGKEAKFRFKGHAQQAFWRWVCSWARACRRPSDLGFDDDGFILPPLIEREHVVKARKLAPGKLFDCPARDMREEREERKRTIPERCEKAAEIALSDPSAVAVWCHLNEEGDVLERLIPESRQICGSQSDDERREIYEAFSSGQLKRIIIKDKIGAWGLNWQHCWRVVRFETHSFEAHYQAVRRFWRYGQTHEVLLDMIATEGEHGIRENRKRKVRQADAMFTGLVGHMNDSLRLDRRQSYFVNKERIPSWL